MTPSPVDWQWLIDDLVARNDDVEHAVVLSEDGLLIAASSAMSEDDAEHLAAIAAGYQSLSRGAARQFDEGRPVRQTVVELQSRFLFVIAAGDGACLAVISSGTCDIGLIAYEMASLVQRVGEHLSTAARPFNPPGGWW